MTDIFIKRPVLAVVVSILIVVAGLQAMRSLSVRQYPRIDSALVTVTTAYIGADAELVRGFISTPLERVIAAADGIDYIESSSAQSISTIAVHLKLNYDPIKALADITSKVNQVRGDLPPEAEVPIINVSPADDKIASMYLCFNSDILAPNQINDYLLRVVQPRLSALSGIQRAEIFGAQTYALRIWLDPARMAALNVSPTDIRTALQANNYLSAIGQTKGSLMQYNLTANTDLRTVPEFKKLVINDNNGSPVRLEDVAEVELGSETYSSKVSFSGRDAVMMGVWVMPTANSLEVIAEVRKAIEEIRRLLPSGLSADIAYDSTTYIEEAISEVKTTLFETILIVMLVIYLFLGSFRAASIPMLTIPISLIGAVFLMQVFGFSLNLLTLLAIVLSVGLVVDDAIVVVENVTRHIHDGLTPFDAAIKGARELVMPVISMTITLAAVYLPVGFQGGLTGALFREFAFTLAGAVFISGVVAITLSPMLSSKFIHFGDDEKGFAGFVLHRFESIRALYTKGLDLTLRNRPYIYLVWIVLTIFAGVFYAFSPKELAPKEDQGIIFGVIAPPPNASLENVVYYNQQAAKVFGAVPEGANYFQVAQNSMGFGGLIIKPWSQRERKIFQIEPEVTGGLAKLTGVRHPAFLPEPLPSAGMYGIEFVLMGTQEPAELLEIAKDIVAKGMESGAFAFLDTDTKIDQSREVIKIDREKVATLGLNLRSVGADMSTMLGGNYVNRFNLDGRSYKVIPQINRVGRLTAEQLDLIYIRGPQNKLLPLSAIAKTERTVEPRSLNRFNQLNAVKVIGVAPRSTADGLAVLEKIAKEILPNTIHPEYGGASRQFKEEAGKFLPAFGLAILLIYLVLAAQFNSFRDPLIILVGSVPLAMFGALIFTVLKAVGPPAWNYHLTEGWTTTLNIYSQVGLVTLVGLISKHGILIVEFANSLREKGMSKLEAIRESSRLRFRPVLMTTAATVFGHIMLIFVTGPGAHARNSIGLVLVLGMSIGSMFTIFILPSIYMLIAPGDKIPAEAANE